MEVGLGYGVPRGYINTLLAGTLVHKVSLKKLGHRSDLALQGTSASRDGLTPPSKRSAPAVPGGISATQ